ncbi:MAG TPA: glycosyl transferase family 51 [Desulfobulbaceae bacterium]|nr:glycosyl transferase family 51 [Desulfobulbaceae bacterium]
MLRFLKYFFLFSLLIVVLLVAAAGGGLYYLVVLHPSPEISQKNIKAILGRESPVLYNDGLDKIGVLFQDYHRQYLRYDQIPKQFIEALVAAEDNRFFHHYGIDPAGILRAMIANIKAGHVVQGGSTLTQQTAKNLFKRHSRSYQAKLKELLYALQLEYHYPKEKILEFYCNQFFVSGNGHGLGVAARYYFNKDPQDLTLLESAFIAGSVKRPNYYNPFTKKNKQQAKLARKRAQERSAYVLRNMLKLQMITRQQYDDATTGDLVFSRGRMAYALNTVMDLVKEGLNSASITRALEDHGISNVSTSGVRIITSVDHDLQAKTLYALRRQLSRLDVRLRGYRRVEVQEEYATMKLPHKKEVQPGDFLLATVRSINRKKKWKVEVAVDLGDSSQTGIIDNNGFAHILSAYVKHEGKRWTKVKEKKDLPRLLKQLHPEDRVYVSVRNIAEDGTVHLDLERYPGVEGAALIMQKGAILAMAGGMENRYFNRAIDARRLMGSTFKPFLFTAALQLGWNSSDLLDNRRNIFVFMDRPYFPRPDHHSPFDRVSMSWAGVNSENVAAVWLLYHLTDYLTPPRLRQVAAYLDMAPRRDEQGEEESYQQFSARIRDTFGIKVDRDILSRAAYEQAVKNLETDFLFEDRAPQYAQLRELPYGLHFGEYLEPIQEELTGKKGKTIKERERRELLLRKHLLSRSYLGLRPLLPLVQEWKNYYIQLREREDSFFSSFTPAAPTRPEGMLVEDDAGRLILTMRKRLPENWYVIGDTAMLRRLEDLDEKEFDRFWKSVQLEGAVCVCAYEQVQAQMERERLKLQDARPYSMEVLSRIRDYRVMVGLQYLIRLGRAMGIKNRLAPVLSFPLGSNVVTLADLTHMYETIVSGLSYREGHRGADTIHPARNGGREFEDGLSIIDRIETPGGEIIYARNPAVRRVIDSETSSAVSHILQNVVKYGTGRYAGEHVRLHSEDLKKEAELSALDLPVPLLGKTGTANQFRNAAFVGYVPAPAGDNDAVMALPGGFTIGTYVGYDKNRPMKSGNTHITGSVGALPIWSDLADAVLEKEKAGERFDPVDLSFGGLGLQYPDTGQLFVPVDPKQGGVVLKGRGGRHARIAPDFPVILTYGIVGAGGRFDPTRLFKPFWRNEQAIAGEK